MSLTEPEDRDANYTVALVCTYRYRGDREKKIAEQLNFDSVEDMHKQLAKWDLPTWLIEGDPRRERAAIRDRDPKKNPNKRKDRNRTTGGPVQELPPFKDAAPLLEEALNQLRYYLEQLVYLQSGARRTPEYLQDRRFIQDTREDAPLWAPDAGGRTRLAGATQWPADGRTVLIGAYLVAGCDPEPLIEKLHYAPEDLDREKLGRVLYGDEKNNRPGLLKRARQAARLIRGADTKTDDKKDKKWPAEFSVEEMVTRHRVLDMRVKDQEILDALSSEGTLITKAELRWLAGLGLPDPPR